MKAQKHPIIYFGGDYNPDQWSEEIIRQDMQYFKKAHINFLVLPVFAWAKLEPQEGQYCFQWLDKILDIIWANGIYVCLATSTSAQPEWMSKKYPEILPVDKNGLKRTHGMRNFFCVNSKKYRERAAALAEQMALRYKDFPGLAAWHVSNEYSTFCHCENCEKKFRNWLREKYGTTENLNEKWNTAFWGRSIYDFDTIMIPSERNDDDRFFPAKELDYLRFVTDTTEECFLNEADVLRRITPGVPVFSNISGYIKKLNQFLLTRNMDWVGWDNYPAPTEESAFTALKHDIMRGLKDGASYLIAEQSPNQQNWQPYNKLKKPGEVRLLAYQGLAHGGDGTLYFQMRQSIGGQEKFHGALVTHAGTCDTRIFHEFEDLGCELAELGGCTLDAEVHAAVAFLFDWDNWWTLELCSGPTKDMDYLEQILHYYRGFYEKNIPVDIVKFSGDLNKYKIVVAPLVYMMKDDVAERIKSFVKQGGIMIATYMTGVADENDRCIWGAYPGPLRKVFGIWVEETDAMFPDETNGIIMNNGKKRYSCSFLCDRIRLEGAEVLGSYESDFYAEEENENGKFYFVINHTVEQKQVLLPEGSWEDLTQLLFVQRIIWKSYMTRLKKPARCRRLFAHPIIWD